MDKKYYTEQTKNILVQNLNIQDIANKLKKLWIKGETKTKNLVKKEQREQIENLGIAVEILKTIGQATGKYRISDIEKYSKLSELLWEEYGREGRIVATHKLNNLNEKSPEIILPLCKTLVASSVSWEECDNMTFGIEPVIRKYPEEYLGKLNDWLTNDNKWVKRAALNVLARLPMKQPKYTKQCLNMINLCLDYDDHDVRRTCSFAIRLGARGDIKEVYNYLKTNIGGSNNTKVWIFSDVIKSMTKSFLSEFKPLLPLYEKWKENLTDKKALKSIDSAIKILKP